MVNNKRLLFLEDMRRIYNSVTDIERIRNKVFLVTGATGMLASYMVFFLIWLNEECDFNLRIIVNCRNEIKCKEKFGKYVECDWFVMSIEDISEFDYSSDCVDRIDYIIHAASLANSYLYGKYPVETILPNVKGTTNLLNYCRDNPSTRLLFLSSTSIYGDNNEREYLIEESTSVLDISTPGNYYGISKLCGEALCKAYFLEYGVSARTVRIAHSYGPTMDCDNDTRVFAEFVKNATNGDNIKIRSSGNAKRMFCYASDCISGMLYALLHGEDGESYNLANPEQEYSIRELAELIAYDIMERKVNIEYVEQDTKEYSPTNKQSLSKVSVEKLKKLGWKYSVNAKNGFMRTIMILMGNCEDK